MPNNMTHPQAVQLCECYCPAVSVISWGFVTAPLPGVFCFRAPVDSLCVYVCVCANYPARSRPLAENPTDATSLSRQAETFSMIYSNCCDGPIVSLCDDSRAVTAAERGGGEREGGRWGPLFAERHRLSGCASSLVRHPLPPSLSPLPVQRRGRHSLLISAETFAI